MHIEVAGRSSGSLNLVGPKAEFSIQLVVLLRYDVEDLACKAMMTVTASSSGLWLAAARVEQSLGALPTRPSK